MDSQECDQTHQAELCISNEFVEAKFVASLVTVIWEVITDQWSVTYEIILGVVAMFEKTA